MRERLILSVISAVLTQVIWVVEALGKEPLYIQNLSPFGGISFPFARGAEVSNNTRNKIIFNTSLANHFVLQQSKSESLFLDGQTTKFSLEWRHAIWDRLDFSVFIPVVSQNSGFLDGEITSWHNFWGLPDGDRKSYQSDSLLYSYKTPSVDIDFSSSSKGIGNIGIAVNYVISSTAHQSTSINFGFSIPSGDSKKFLGRDSEEWSLAIRQSGASRVKSGFVWNAHAGYIFADNQTQVFGQLDKFRWFLGGSIGFDISDKVAGLVQLDAFDSVISSPINALGEPAVMLSLGVRLKLSEKWTLDLSFSEDIKVESAPDITFNGTFRLNLD